MRALIALLVMTLSFHCSTTALADPAANRHTATRVLLEKMGQGDFSKLDEIYAPDFVVHSGAQTFDLAYDNESARALRRAVPDMVVQVRRVAGEGDMVAVHWSASGINSVAAAGMPGNGRAAAIEGMTFFRFENGRIVEEWSVTDMLSLMRSLGVMP